jgi:hypothetical protein
MCPHRQVHILHSILSVPDRIIIPQYLEVMFDEPFFYPYCSTLVRFPLSSTYPTKSNSLGLSLLYSVSTLRPYLVQSPGLVQVSKHRLTLLLCINSCRYYIVTIVCMLLLANAPLHVLVLFHSTSIHFQTCNYISYCMLWHYSM